MSFIFDPDSPPAYDTAELQHELTRFAPTRRDTRPPAVSSQCPECHASPLTLEHAGHRPGCTGAALTRGRALVRVAEDCQYTQRPIRAPGLDRRDPARALLLIGALLSAVLALAAIGLGAVTLWTADHWRGVLQAIWYGLAAAWLCWVVALCNRRGAQ